MKFNFKKCYSNAFFSIEEGFEENTDYKNNRSEPYYRLTTDNSVICCVMDKLGNFVMVEQFRPNLDCFTLELPAGGIKIGETPMEAAVREFEEETGMTSTFLPLGKFHLMMNRVNSKEYVFFGFDPEISQGKKVDKEIKVKQVLREDLENYALNGKYRQLAGLGVIQIASTALNLDILKAPLEDISETFYKKVLIK